MDPESSDPELDALLAQVASAEPVATPPDAGDRIAGRFVVQSRGRSGGMGTVYRASDEQTGQTVAVKLLHGVADAQRFAREAAALAALDEDTVVRYVGHGVSERGEAFLAMHWLEGRDLRARIGDGALGLAEVVTLGARLCEGLAAIHRAGLLHRDLKPANVMLVGGECEQATIVDLGLARRQQGASRVTRTGAILGTVGYMSPEQARGMRSLSAATDLFSLGCVLHECLTGVPAFEGANAAAVLAKVLIGQPAPLRSLRPEVPEALAMLVERLLAKDPAARGDDAAQVGRVLATLSIEASAGPTLVRQPVRGGERRVVGALLIAPPLGAADGETVNADSTPAAARTIASAVTEFGGVATTLAGDMVVVGFDDAGSAAERATRAALCALALVQAEPTHRIALALGRSDVTAEALLGDALDRAATLIAQADPGTIAIDESTARLLGGRFEVVSKDGRLRLKAQIRSGERGGQRLLGKLIPFVGRRKELAFLRAAVEDVVEEQTPQVVIVSAPAGAGKSRLAFELRRTVEAPAMALYASTTPLSRDSAGALARALVRSAVQTDHPSHEQLLQHTRALALELPDDVAEFLGELLGISLERPTPKLLAARRDPGVMANRVSTAFATWLRAEAERHPLVLILEDTHWADLASLGYIDLALRRDPPILVLALTRPEGRDAVDETFSRLRPETIELRPLSDRAAARIAHTALDDEAVVDDTIIGDLVRRANGNPFFLEELVRAVAAGQQDMPDTVIALAEDRVGRLEPELRRVLRAASVFGRTSWVAGVAQVAGLRDVTSALEAMDRLVDAELLGRQPNSRLDEQLEYRFVHALPRDAVYGMIPERERPGAHALAAHWLESTGETDAATLAEHYALAADRDRALRWRVEATKRALAAGNHTAVLRHLERARPLEPDGDAKTDLLVCEARSGLFGGAYQSTARASGEAMNRLPTRSDAWFAMVGCLGFTSMQVDDKKGLGAAMFALGDPRDLRGATGGHALAVTALLVTNLVGMGTEAAGPYHEAARRIGREAHPDDLWTQGWVHMSEGFMAWYSDGAPAHALLEATALFERSGELSAYAFSLIGSAMAEAFRGRHDALRALLLRTRQLGEEYGLWSAYPMALSLLCYSELHVDDDEAEALMAEAAGFSQDAKVETDATTAARVYRAMVRGDWETCRSLSDALVSSGLHDYRVSGAVGQAWSALELGDPQRAAELAELTGATIERAGGSPRLRTMLADLRVRLAVESGDHAKAARVARTSLERLERRSLELAANERHLYWADAPWVARAKARIDQVLADEVLADT